MINYISGKVVEKGENYIVLECNDIGYEIFVSNTTLNSIDFLNQDIKIRTYLQVKEDGLTFFGFCSKEEKNMFLKLINVSGIGAKMAMSILSGMSLVDLINSIYSGDVKMLTQIKGLGKKTAERLVLELKDKSLDSVDFGTMPINSNIVNSDYVADVSMALESLGVAKNEAYRLAKENYSEELSVEEIITKALRNMGS